MELPTEQNLSDSNRLSDSHGIKSLGKMFCDLNIRLPQNGNVESSLDRILERLLKYGYRKVAITTEVNEGIFEKCKKETKKKNLGNSDPNDVLLPPPDLSKLKAKFPKMCFYNRINIVINESSNIRKFTQCKNLKKYDLISFQPESQAVLKSLAGIAEIDIVSYNPENKCCLLINRKLYNQFVTQNVYFELVYGPAIADSTARKNLLSLSHVYTAIGKSKNVIVSSGAETENYIRSPHDVMNFNLLFGLTEEQCKMSVTRNCERLLLRARKQRRNKAMVEIVKLESFGADQNAMDIDMKEEKEMS